jgi:hypothetical protein
MPLSSARQSNGHGELATDTEADDRRIPYGPIFCIAPSESSFTLSIARRTAERGFFALNGSEASVSLVPGR